MLPNPNADKKLKVWTVGHSIYPMEEFIELLRKHDIEVVADVRSNPYSRYATHFHGPSLQNELRKTGLKYVFLGSEIGGKPKEREFYDAEGFADYGKLASSEKFKAGMERLLNGIRIYRVALMCGEEDPAGCHRHLLIGKVAFAGGVEVLHIRKGGLIQDFESLARESEPESFATQLNLFGSNHQIRTQNSQAWRSALQIRKPEESEDYYQ